MSATALRLRAHRRVALPVRGPGWSWLPGALRRRDYWRIVAAFALVGPLVGGAPYAILIVTVPFIYLFGFIPALLAGLMFAAWWTAPGLRPPTWPWRAALGALSGVGAAGIVAVYIAVGRTGLMAWGYPAIVALHGVPAATILALLAPRFAAGRRGAATPRRAPV